MDKVFGLAARASLSRGAGVRGLSQMSSSGSGKGKNPQQQQYQHQQQGVVHDPKKSRFTMDLGNGKSARIDYRKLGATGSGSGNSRTGSSSSFGLGSREPTTPGNRPTGTGFTGTTRTTRSKSAALGDSSDCHQYDLYHTEVPHDLRGKGVGKQLAKGALDQLSKEGAKVKLSCSYLIDYVKKHAADKYNSMIHPHESSGSGSGSSSGSSRK